MSGPRTVPVPPHGSVTLVDAMGDDATVVARARASTDGAFRGWPGDERLLRYLMAHAHTSPFEMVELVFEVVCPLVVARQWQRHRTFSYNELSGRYAALPAQQYVPARDGWRRQDPRNRQGSAGRLDPTDAACCEALLVRAQEAAARFEAVAREYGVAREQARLATNLTRYTRFYVKGNLHNWFRFLRLRLHPAAQAETRAYAAAVATLVRERCPRSYALFEEYILYSVRLNRSEVEELRAWLAALPASPARDRWLTRLAASSSSPSPS